MKKALLLGTALCLSAAHVACAQTAQGRPTTELTEVVVTAQRVTELASKTPIAISVFSGDQLQKQGVVNVFDLQNVAPGVTIQKNGNQAIVNIRGVTTSDVSSKGDSGVSFNIDGIPVSRPRLMAVSFFDIERVEVLRGPQGTLYGKSSTGGAVNIITAKPKNAFDASASAELGNYNTRRGEAMINVPVTDTIAVRGALSYNFRDGYLKTNLLNTQNVTQAPNNRNDQDDLSGRLTAKWNFSDTGSLVMTGNWGHIGGIGTSSAIVRVDNLPTTITAGMVPPTADRVAHAQSGKAALNAYYNPMGARTDESFANYNAELNFNVGPVHVTYDGGRLHMDAYDLISSTNDPRGRIVNLLGAAGNTAGFYGWQNYYGDITTDSHELRFANADPQRLEWIAGYNYYKENIVEDDHSWSNPISNTTLAGSVNGNSILATTKHKSDGFFGQINFHATDALKFTVGARKSTDQVERRGTFASGVLPGALPNGTGGGFWLNAQGTPCVAPQACVKGSNGFIPRNDGDQNASKTTWRVGVDYQLTDSQLLYASAASGYKAGGFNDFSAASALTGAFNPGSYMPEELIAYEAGYKGQIRPNLQVLSSAFYYDYSAAQISSGVTTATGTANFTYTTPIIIYGWENEVHWKPTAADQIDATLALEAGHFKNLKLAIAGQPTIDWTDQGIDRAPKSTAMVAYTHRWFLESVGDFEARISSRYNSGYRMSDYTNAIHYRQEAFTRSDLSVTYTAPSSKLSVQAYVRNIENKLQLTNNVGNANTTNLSAVQANAINTYRDVINANLSDPRTFGVRVTVKY